MGQINFGTMTGPHYEPHLTETGDEMLLSFTNDGGLPNPAPVNVKGAKGADGAPGTPGAKGDKGDPGQDATINGQSAVAIEAGENISLAQSGGTLSIAAVVPSNTSDLTNDSGFVTNAANDLINYYLKSETYTKAETNALISAIPKLDIQVVASLPTSDISAETIYLVTTGDESQNLYTEYIYVDNAWEKLGTQTLDLSGYATTAAMNAALAGYVQKETGKGLSTNDYTDAEKTKVAAALTQHQDISGKQDKLPATGAANKGVYVSASGVVSAMTYELNKSVPANAVFTDTDTTYTLTQDANDGHKFTLSGSDGTSKTITIPDNNTWTAMTGATASANGAAGYVPAPPKDGYNAKYLRADGSWSVPPDTNTTYTPATAAPLMDGPAAVGTSAKYAREDHRHPPDETRASAADVAKILDYLAKMEAYRTASGNPATFSDGKAANVKALSVTITPAQSGSGDPSPSNVRPITGVSSVRVTRSDAPSQIIAISFAQSGSGDPSPSNVRPIAPGLSFARDDDSTLAVYGGTLDVAAGTLTVTHKYFKLAVADMNNETYFPGWRGDAAFAGNVRLCVPEGHDGLLEGAALNIGAKMRGNWAYAALFFTVGDYGMAQSQWKGSYPDLEIEAVLPLVSPVAYRLTPTETERALAALGYAGKAVTVALTDGTSTLSACGGTLNVTTGELIMTHKLFQLPSSAEWRYRASTATHSIPLTVAAFGGIDATPSGRARAMSSHYKRDGSADFSFTAYAGDNFYLKDSRLTSANALNEYIAEQENAGTPIQCLFPLAAPVTYQLTPAQLAALAGYNAVSADAGTLSVTYLSDPSIALGGG